MGFFSELWLLAISFNLYVKTTGPTISRTYRIFHNPYVHTTVFLCFTCMFLTLTLQLDEFCLDYEGLSHNCDLGWGGYAAIAAGALYFLAAIALCKMPMYKETPVESDEPDEVVTKDDADGAKEDKIADEEAPEEAPAQ